MTRYPKKGKGGRWTQKELLARVNDSIADGDGLVGEVRVSSGGEVAVRFKYGMAKGVGFLVVLSLLMISV